MSFTLFFGDCVQVMEQWPDCCVDALVTDPPAGISFMGRKWDDDKGGRDGWVKWLASVMKQALRCLKPGGYGLVWALPRTSHWTGWALESAGFEVRDRIAFLFGTGFPKSADQGDGVGTALKPACEDWWLVRRPLEGTYAENIARWGTGGLNIDATRIAGRVQKAAGNLGGYSGAYQTGTGREYSDSGRWPANVVLDEDAAAVLDKQSGYSKSTGSIGACTAAAAAARQQVVAFGAHTSPRGEWKPYGDEGGASRFFYTTKPSRSERELGCEDLPVQTAGEVTGRKDGSTGLKSPRAGAGRTAKEGVRNGHPTVKSVALMRYLCRLITPPGGLVLDCFAGSGTTGIAALREGLRFAGIERELPYLAIAAARVGAAAQEKEDHAQSEIDRYDEATPVDARRGDPPTPDRGGACRH